ncbi:MAG: sulfatase-like hydrolase/transferase [Planctomycetota bacterium]|nr:sulfatase-like hydrolase/transferase [Planctomycetota bacterium]
MSFVTALAIGSFIVLQSLFSASLTGSFSTFMTAWIHPYPDLCFAIAIAALGTAAGKQTIAVRIASVLVLLSLLLQTAATLVPAFLERKFELADIREAPGLYHLLLHDQQLWQHALAIGGVTLAILGSLLLLIHCIKNLTASAASAQVLCRWLLAMQALVFASVIAGSVSTSGKSLWQPSALASLVGKLVDEVAHQCNPELLDSVAEQRLLAASTRLAAASGVGMLAGADVHLMFVESYGRVCVRQPQLAQRMASLYAEFDRDLRAKNYTVKTAMCFPEVTGGGSFLTHAQMYASVPVPDRFMFDRVIASTLEPLPKRFQASGYHTVEILPAMHRHWPMGAMFYGFDEALTQQELDYHGLLYHWGQMPDQYALHQLLTKVVRKAKTPLFTSFVSVTSHAPFRMIPHYLADWQIDANSFNGPPRIEHPVTWLNMLHDQIALTAYSDSIEYSLRTIVGFACQLERPSLVILLGDHQPPIAAAMDPPDHTKDVPIHVFANRPELLTPLRELGFVDGFSVPDSMTAFSTVEIAPMLLRALGR